MNDTTTTQTPRGRQLVDLTDLLDFADYLVCSNTYTTALTAVALLRAARRCPKSIVLNPLTPSLQWQEYFANAPRLSGRLFLLGFEELRVDEIGRFVAAIHGTGHSIIGHYGVDSRVFRQECEAQNIPYPSYDCFTVDSVTATSSIAARARRELLGFRRCQEGDVIDGILRVAEAKDERVFPDLALLTRQPHSLFDRDIAYLLAQMARDSSAGLPLRNLYGELRTAALLEGKRRWSGEKEYMFSWWGPQIDVYPRDKGVLFKPETLKRLMVHDSLKAFMVLGCPLPYMTGGGALRPETPLESFGYIRSDRKPEGQKNVIGGELIARVADPQAATIVENALRVQNIHIHGGAFDEKRNMLDLELDPGTHRLDQLGELTFRVLRDLSR